MPVLHSVFDELIASYRSNGVIYPYRIVKIDTTTPGTVIQASAVTDAMIGISKIVQTTMSRYQRYTSSGTGTGPATTLSLQDTTIPPAIAGDQVDVHILGIQPVQYGATVTIGQWLTSDSVGRAIPAASGNRIIGIAMIAGVVDDIGSVLINRAIFP